MNMSNFSSIDSSDDLTNDNDELIEVEVSDDPPPDDDSSTIWGNPLLVQMFIPIIKFQKCFRN